MVGEGQKGENIPTVPSPTTESAREDLLTLLGPLIIPLAVHGVSAERLSSSLVRPPANKLQHSETHEGAN